MNLIATKPLYRGGRTEVSPGQQFEEPDQSIARKLLREGKARVSYETKVVIPEVGSRPFVTAICPTRNRRAWLPKAIKCFQAQTFPSKELLIVADGEQVADLIPADHRIRLIVLRTPLSLGLKRNFCCEQALGDVIVHFDDDDWSHPNRITEQVEALKGAARVVGYYSMYFDGPGDEVWHYGLHEQYALGTSLAYWKTWWRDHPFPDETVGEDKSFLNLALPVLKAFSGDARMVATSHPANTSQRRPKGKKQWRLADRAALPKEYVDVR